MTVQDDERERELVRLFNLDWDAAHQRSGVDALIDLEVDGKMFRLEVEVKSSTTNSVSTARDVGMNHIEKWRKKLFVIGFYSRHAGRPEFKRSLCLTPIDMEPWISTIEEKILIDYRIAEIASERLVLDDLFKVCGKSNYYTIEDAKRVHKQQWSKEKYLNSRDITVDGVRKISQEKMLEILQLRSRYISERGATLNNPHITSSYLSRFFETDSEIVNNWANRIQSIAKSFIQKNQGHPSIIPL
jgi:hypothetical protein